MYNPFGGNKFPYSNFHELNLDWIIQVAKDFLDKYTEIENIINTGKAELNQTIETGETDLNNTISEGVSDLQTKADQMEDLLQAWYDTHSEDIANELLRAIASFTASANERAQEAIESIPEDYSDFYAEFVNQIAFNTHFYYEGKEPYYDSHNRTITFYAGCPFIVGNKSYGSYTSSNTVVNIPDTETSTDYMALLLNLATSTGSVLNFEWARAIDLPIANKAMILVINKQDNIVGSTINVSIDGVLRYARGSDLNVIRNQMNYLSQRMSGSEIVFSFDKYPNGYIKSYDGTVGYNASTGYTGFIYIEGIETITCPIDHVATYQMAFYDSTQTYISGAQRTPNQVEVWKLNVPNNAYYCRMSYYLDVENSFYVHGTARTYSRLKGLKLSILGDSFSTFSGYNPSGYAYFYPRGDVDEVDKTWWKKLINNTGMVLLKNASYSGSTIAGDTSTTSGFVGASDTRIAALANGNEKPDIVIIEMGINDFGKDNGISCGTYSGRSAVTSDTVITNIADALAVTIKKVQDTYKNAMVFVCTLTQEKFSSEMQPSYINGFPNINPTDSKSLTEMNELINKIAVAFGCGVIAFNECGINFYNVGQKTIDGLHPTADTHTTMSKIAETALMKNI